MRPHSSHYSSVMPIVPNQMAVSAHQPINIGIAHVVWPQPASNKRNKPSQNRSATAYSHWQGLKPPPFEPYDTLVRLFFLVFTLFHWTAKMCWLISFVLIFRSMNVSHYMETQPSVYPSPKMADRLASAAPQPSSPGREVQVQVKPEQVEEEGCCKVAVANQQRESFIIRESPSPAVSVISISSGTDEEEQAQRCSLNKWVEHSLCISFSVFDVFIQ